MGYYLRQSTATTIPVGPLIDDTDFKSRETAIAYNQTGVDCAIMKNNGTWDAVTITDTGGDNDWVNKGDGTYTLELTAAQTDTLGPLVVSYYATGILVWSDTFYVIPQKVFDSLFAGSAATAGDPLQNQVPGNYPSGTAGHALGRIGSGQIATVSPVSPDGTILNLVRGDDYDSADGRALDFVDSSANWPDLTNASAKFKMDKIDKECEIVVAEGAAKKLRVELTNDETAKLDNSLYDFEIEVTLTNNHIVTLITGKAYIN
jgi:hypothetical protein